jgi:hypothetical protein
MHGLFQADKETREKINECNQNSRNNEHGHKIYIVS